MFENSSNNFYRSLSNEEIGQLIHQGCSSTDWSLIKVSKDFIPDPIENSKFTGHIYLNSFNTSVKLEGELHLNQAYIMLGFTIVV